MRRIALLLSTFAFTLISAYAQTQTVGVFTYEGAAFEGYTLITPNSSMKSYLINNYGEKVNEWESGVYLVKHIGISGITTSKLIIKQ